MTGRARLAVFDLDGTLLDSDAALVAPFLALGVPADTVTFGHVLEDECARLAISMDDYLGNYDDTLAQPFSGVCELLDSLDRWAVCSNKQPAAATAELARLGWRPDVAMFADAFDGPKRLGPVLRTLGLQPDEIVFVGDTDHDRACAAAVGCRFVLAAWNPRCTAEPGDLVAEVPAEVLDHLID